MDNLLAVTFEAHNPEFNHHRRYTIHVGKDLFGDWTVAFRYGRTGRGGQEVRHADSDPESLRKLIRQCLRRRLSAPKRIGCQYQLTELNAADDAIGSEWLPADLLLGFSAMAICQRSDHTAAVDRSQLSDA